MRVRNLKLNLKKIQDYIGLKTDFWVNTTTTNCYAYALGLDIPETNIVEGAYRLGTLGAIKEKITACVNDNIKKIYIPKENEKDLNDISKSILDAILPVIRYSSTLSSSSNFNTTIVFISI